MGEANAPQSDAIYTRDEAVLIVEMFENVLDTYNIKVPSPEDDEREPDNEAKLFIKPKIDGSSGVYVTAGSTTWLDGSELFI